MSRSVILMYHAVDEPRCVAEARYCVTPAAFRAQMEHVVLNRQSLIPLSTLVEALKAGSPLRADSLVVTFDDGYECFQRNALPVIRDFRIPVTVFAVAGKLGETNSWMRATDGPARRLMSAQELRAIQEAGVTIGCHGLSHTPLTTSSDAELVKETADARRMLKDVLGNDVTLFAYPHGAQGERERQAVASAGFVAACSTESGFIRHPANLFALRRIDVYGSDTLASFRRKLQFGANRVTRVDLIRYYCGRAIRRIHD